MIARLAALPDRDEAREWAERELEKQIYREAEPTLFDRVAQRIGEFFQSLFNPQIDGAGWSPVWTAIIVAVLVAGIVVAFVIWGMPRGEGRSRARASTDLFDADERSAAELRAASTAARDRGDWDEAIILRYRAIARGIDERGLLHGPPGMTARTFAVSAAGYFPAHAAGLDAAAGMFDDVRYLRRPGTAEAAASVADLDDTIASARPAKAAEAAFA
ncbi:DUF4129 domain-containing protein [Microbacterium karelineae]|uniref:DUF4129 domain-containing protein n=1 Tax=Microbacterium karelineae TaxID=2654283 RepID=UPI0012EA39CB|nr:DUF4129 domain-containing protein [Microbacterium karelineae]